MPLNPDNELSEYTCPRGTTFSSNGKNFEIKRIQIGPDGKITEVKCEYFGGLNPHCILDQNKGDCTAKGEQP